MPIAEIITIGTEILLGEIVDTNARFIARKLRDLGIDVYRTTTVGDNIERIALAVRESLERSQIIITSGGLGPTVDDPTRAAIAAAFGVELEYRPELWEQIQARFERYGRIPTENNRRQAYIPAGATPVENPVGTAPSFIVEVGGRAIFCLPGVPREMEYLMENAVTPYLREHFGLDQVIKSRILHTSGAGESQVDELIGDLEALNNPTVGLAAHAGQVDVRITAKSATIEAADGMIAQVEDVLRQRLGAWIYGVDEETLEGAALEAVVKTGWKLGVLEAGLNGLLIRRLGQMQTRLAAGEEASHQGGGYVLGEALADLPASEELSSLAEELLKRKNLVAVMAAALYPGGEKQVLYMHLETPAGSHSISRSYGGPPLLALSWATNTCLDFIRKIAADKS